MVNKRQPEKEKFVESGHKSTSDCFKGKKKKKIPQTEDTDADSSTDTIQIMT